VICRIPFVNRMALIHALVKVSIELTEIYFHFFEMFIVQIGEMAFYSKPELLLSNQIIFRLLKKANAFWMILKHQ
jgi:hypothetical protein